MVTAEIADESPDLIVGILETFAERLDDLVSYLEHVKFDLGAMRDGRDLMPAWLGHYRSAAGRYDVDRACNDLATWPPIASRIAELMNERAAAYSPGPLAAKTQPEGEKRRR